MMSDVLTFRKELIITVNRCMKKSILTKSKPGMMPRVMISSRLKATSSDNIDDLVNRLLHSKKVDESMFNEYEMDDVGKEVFNLLREEQRQELVPDEDTFSNKLFLTNNAEKQESTSESTNTSSFILLYKFKDECNINEMKDLISSHEDHCHLEKYQEYTYTSEIVHDENSHGCITMWFGSPSQTDEELVKLIDEFSLSDPYVRAGIVDKIDIQLLFGKNQTMPIESVDSKSLDGPSVKDTTHGKGSPSRPTGGGKELHTTYTSMAESYDGNNELIVGDNVKNFTKDSLQSLRNQTFLDELHRNSVSVEGSVGGEGGDVDIEGGTSFEGGGQGKKKDSKSRRGDEEDVGDDSNDPDDKSVAMKYPFGLSREKWGDEDDSLSQAGSNTEGELESTENSSKYNENDDEGEERDFTFQDLVSWGMDRAPTDSTLLASEEELEDSYGDK